MLQKEVVDRITANAHSKNYGRLSVMMQFHFDCEAGRDIDPDAFSPPPKVDSAMIKLLPRPLSVEQQALEKRLAIVVKTAFAQRRKTLKNSLKELLNDEDFNALGIDCKARAENLEPQHYYQIASYLARES